MALSDRPALSGPAARGGARPDCGLSHTGDSVGGPERRPRQTARLRRGIPAEAIGQKPKPRSGGPDVAVTQIRTEWPEIPAETRYSASCRKRSVCGDWMVVDAVQRNRSPGQ